MKTVEAGDMSVNSALEIVETVKSKRENIVSQLDNHHSDLQSSSFYFKVLEVKKLWKHDATSVSSTLITEIEELNELISRYYGVSLT